MYINDLSNIETWTKVNMGGLPGACVPETMRFNGNGGDPGSGSCTEAASPLWNAEDITSGPLADGAYTLTATATDAIASPVTSTRTRPSPAVTAPDVPSFAKENRATPQTSNSCPPVGRNRSRSGGSRDRPYIRGRR